MKIIRDCFGRSVRLTDERLTHILEHAELAGMEDEIERLLQSPTEVRRSRSDDNVMLFTRALESVGNGCVGCKVLAG
jgi:hypothetical protein